VSEKRAKTSFATEIVERSDKKTQNLCALCGKPMELDTPEIRGTVFHLSHMIKLLYAAIFRETT
jgi:hypothetical protein